MFGKYAKLERRCKILGELLDDYSEANERIDQELRKNSEYGSINALSDYDLYEILNPSVCGGSRFIEYGEPPYSNENIMKILENAQEYLSSSNVEYSSTTSACATEKEIRPITPMQMRHAKFAIAGIMDGIYMGALSEFSQCVCDYGRYREKQINLNECALYSCILECFMPKLESALKNNILK